MAKELSMTEDELRAAMYQAAGKESMRLCSDKDLYLILCHLGRLKDLKKTQLGYATPQQLWKIRELEKQLGWTDNSKRLRKFMEKYSEIQKLEWLKFKQAGDLIESLKKVLKRERSKKDSQEKLQKA
ncbi:phage protein GemA/Gp16 family protein [Syntrophobotulus glycolicus]|nr:phage protein GemA/Gp16 family protein [Syntrophobotulus glycolicus]